ncbi:FAD-dependent oxidoreductase [Streptomyces sp. NPDC057909]|uniref:FAD-dependent oxidoreductase n=1 Tax=Streptomyces sp. NPDC057909 TaxID=3346277 RepID=UPI0036ECE7F1
MLAGRAAARPGTGYEHDPEAGAEAQGQQCRQEQHLRSDRQVGDGGCAGSRFCWARGPSARIDEWRVGNRPVSLDTYPLIGWGPRENLYLATGTYRDGFHNSPLIAKIMADDLLGSSDRYEHPFVPTRAPFSVMTAQESAAETAYHTASLAYEASLNWPRFWSHDALPRLFLQSPQKMYEDLGEPYGLSPDLVRLLARGARSNDGPDRDAYLRVKSLLQTRGVTTLSD